MEQKKPSLIKWETHYNSQINWKNVFTKAVKTTSDPQLKWFQMRTVHRLIPTNRFLHLRKIKNSPLCTFGCGEEETITHLFFKCQIVLRFWNGIHNWIKSNCSHCDNFLFSEQLIVLGTKNNTITDKVIDLLILIGKWHIYKCKLQDKQPSLEIMKQQFRDRYLIEKKNSISNARQEIFNTTWQPYKQLIS